MTYQTILDFWFSDKMRAHWFAKSDAIDANISNRFLAIYNEAQAGAYDGWENAPRGRLALIILYDQFTRNMFRDTARMFEADAQALRLTQEGIGQNITHDFTTEEKQFFYMPLMHSEDEEVQAQSVHIFETELDDNTADFARQHRHIIVRFGRYPHRNILLNRKSSDAEKEFLKQPNSSF